MGNGPWVEENDLDVEDDEDHRDEEEPDGETLGRLTSRDDPALVGRGLAVVRTSGGEQARGDEAKGGEQERQDQEDDNGQVLGEHVTRSRFHP